MTKVTFKQCEVERLLRAARRQGYGDPAVEKRPDGSLVLLTRPPLSPVNSGADDDLDAELEEFRRRNGDG